MSTAADTLSLSMVDLLALFYLAWGLFKGLRRGLGRELEALIKLLLMLAWLWGFGAFSWLRNTLDGLAQASPLSAGMLGSLAAILLSFFLLYLVRERLAGAVDQHLSKAGSRLTGGIVGLLRAATWSAAVLIVAEKLPWLGDSIRHSLSGGLLQSLIG